MSLLPAPTTCRYTVAGPFWSRRFSRLSLFLTLRSGSLWRPFRGPGGCLRSSSRLVEAMARRRSCERVRGRRWRWWLVEGELPPRRNTCVRSRSFTWTVFILSTLPTVVKTTRSASLQGENTHVRPLYGAQEGTEWPLLCAQTAGLQRLLHACDTDFRHVVMTSDALPLIGPERTLLHGGRGGKQETGQGTKK